MTTKTPKPFSSDEFVKKYYHVLHQQPERISQFYEELSVVSRPGTDGIISTVSTVNKISEKIMLLNPKDYNTEISTINVQDLEDKGVIVRVRGCLTGKDKVGRNFTQSFFMFPRPLGEGHYVRNDVFRYVNNGQVLRAEPKTITAAAVEPVPDAAAPIAPDLSNGFEVNDATKKSYASSGVRQGAEPAGPVVQEDTPKKSYASVVKGAKRSVGPKSPAPAPASAASASNRNIGLVAEPAGPVVEEEDAPFFEVPKRKGRRKSLASDPNRNITLAENVGTEGSRIYIYNLPNTATHKQVEEVFKEFGKIKPGGVIVRINKISPYAYVEFEQWSSKKQALTAGKVNFNTKVTGKTGVTFEKRLVFIEEETKRTQKFIEEEAILMQGYLDYHHAHGYIPAYRDMGRRDHGGGGGIPRQ